VPVSVTVLESQWDAAFERYRLAVRQFGSRSTEARSEWSRANSTLDDVVVAAQRQSERDGERTAAVA
jgi:hypothetical protein